MDLEENIEITCGKSEEFSRNSNDEMDLLPEYCQYRDEGCDLAESCLNCPFSNCIYDEPGGKQRWLKRMRAREMSRLFTTRNKGVKELSLMFGVSQRTVQRALKLASSELVIKNIRARNK